MDLDDEGLSRTGRMCQENPDDEELVVRTNPIPLEYPSDEVAYRTSSILVENLGDEMGYRIDRVRMERAGKPVVSYPRGKYARKRRATTTTSSLLSIPELQLIHHNEARMTV